MTEEEKQEHNNEVAKQLREYADRIEKGEQVSIMVCEDKGDTYSRIVNDCSTVDIARFVSSILKDYPRVGMLLIANPANKCGDE